MPYCSPVAGCLFLMVVGLLARFADPAHGQPQPQGPAPAPAPPAYKLSTETGPLRIGIIGLVHGHVEGLLWQASQCADLKIVGITEPDRAVFDRLAAKYKLDPELYHATTTAMLDAVKPEAVSVMSSIKDHLPAVEACAPRGVHVLLEKPLAFLKQDARHIDSLAREHRVLILTNFETSWYASVREAKRMVESGERAPIRRMVFRHGHKGPKEIGCSQEFLAWLTDPRRTVGAPSSISAATARCFLPGS